MICLFFDGVSCKKRDLESVPLAQIEALEKKGYITVKGENIVPSLNKFKILEKRVKHAYKAYHADEILKTFKEVVPICAEDELVISEIIERIHVKFEAYRLNELKDIIILMLESTRFRKWSIILENIDGVINETTKSYIRKETQTK